MKLLISAGDYSADLHGESLVRALKKKNPDLSVTALGGVRLKSVADTFLKDMVEMDVSGFSQPVKQFFKLKDILTDTVFPILEKKQVDAVVLIDYYGFNIHIAKKAKKEGIPVFYFVSPQVWASRKWRIQRLKESVTKMLVIFPFEKELYEQYGVPVEFVGHPVMDAIATLGEATAPKNPNGKIRLGLMPGSRVREISRHVPIMLRCFEDLQKKFGNLEAVLFAVDALPDSLYQKYLKDSPVKLVRNAGYNDRLNLTLCLTASGTATLENALLGIPMIVIYQASWLTYLVARMLIQVPYVSMANILSGREVVPELIQHRANPDEIVRAASRYLADPALLERTRSELIKLRKVLGKPGAYDRAAASILADL
ncbi:MAG: lipid-A-disaccharide synthase [Elusimicrobia bacterium RIFCSPLOWO2_01_FULL_54_10]|nr:MAG: lipid-A-disaccharide synthase [Elusimicrobia bacterium RIFCSPLOWO2_01_FULL_54_10]